MALVPDRFEQDEPFTTRLRGILAEYPPGTTILKELLQNADDAGAKVITYRIDTKCYGREYLVDRGLAEHQGPALVVYNDAQFTENDFTSLKRLGDSVKMENKLATGKFGLGFNSVYGWTDTPLLISGSAFIALSPHKRLQTSPGSKGIRVDFVSEGKRHNITDQLAGFSAVTTELDKAFPGTIVRIPFRTMEQASWSEITKKETTASDVARFFEEFQTDVAECLVFLKSIETLEFYIDGKKFGSTIISKPELVRPMRISISNAISNTSSTSCKAQFEIFQEYNGTQRLLHYLVQQHLFDVAKIPIRPEIQSWSTKQKLIPWIALAAPLHATPIPPQSRLFSSLPLPIPLENTLVNVHSVFALKRDRRSLWDNNDISSEKSTMNEVLWNNLLVSDLMPVVWLDLLTELTNLRNGVYEYFPLMGPAVGSLFNDLAGNLLRKIVQGKYKIWSSTDGRYLSLEEGFLVTESKPPDALQGISIPLLSKIPARIVHLIQQSGYPHQILSPASVRIWLRGNLKAGYIKDNFTAMNLLEYITQDGRLDQLYDLPLFLCTDGQFHSLRTSSPESNLKFRDKFYIGTTAEIALFSNEAPFLALAEYPSTVSARIRNKLRHMSTALNLENFTLESFRNYAHNVLFSRTNTAELSDVVEMSYCNTNLPWIQQLWTWLESKYVGEVSETVESLHLIPLQGGKKLYKISRSGAPILAQTGDNADLISSILYLSGRRFPVVDSDFKMSRTGFLRSTRRIVDTTDLEALLQWITPEIINGLGNSVKDRYKEHLVVSLRRRLGIPLHKEEHEKLLKLPLFKKVVSVEGKSGDTVKTEHSPISKTKCFPISQLQCVPIIPESEFFDASTDTDRELFKILGYQLLSTETLVNDFVIPNLDSQPPWLIDPLIELLFEEISFSAREDIIQLLKSRPFVIASDRKGNNSIPAKRIKPCKVIDKHSEISGLYFDDEQVFAAGKYSSDVFRQKLIVLGMKTRFDADIAEDRIKCFHSRKEEHRIIGKCRDLLTFLNNSHGAFDLKSEWLSLIQIPALKNDKRMLLPPSECRPKSFAPFVEGVLGIVPLQLEQFLWDFFDWDHTLEPKILSSRINIVSSMTSSSDAQLALLPVLKYIDRRAYETTLDVEKYISAIKSELSSRPWLPGSTDGLWSTDRVFFRNARTFEPYLTELPTMWSHKFSKILSLFGVQKEPTSSDLLDFIGSLDTTTPLSASSLIAVIVALERIDSEFNAAMLPKIRIPDTQGYLLDIDEFSEATLASDQSFARYAHRKVPSSLAFNCGIPQFEEDLVQIKQLQADGIFEDYVQEENMITRIAKQVQESTLWLSFNEFVANAEDCGTATKVHWILDPETCKYPTKQLFCPELKVWQSPGLYVYNDGVFTDKDFKALVNVGMGSKAGDSTKIGKYGLGALTMYLFTDVPSIISGEYFVIFDPLRKFLPIDRAQRRRKAGLRIRLSQMKELFTDHLVPFVGIGGYNIDDTNYAGTIFRFPLRNKQQYDTSPFTVRSENHMYDELKVYLGAKYIDQARRSLIMLKHVRSIEFQVKDFYEHSKRVSASSIKSAIPLPNWAKKHIHKREQSADLWTPSKGGTRETIWRVSSEMGVDSIHRETDDGKQFNQIESFTLDIKIDKLDSNPKVEKWLVTKAFIRDMSVIPSNLRKFSAEERLVAAGPPVARSVPDVAIAAPLTGDPAAVGSLFYNSLPLDMKCALPVNFHARLAISPDRRTVRTDGKGGEWNKFLAEGCLSKIYFIFLERLAPLQSNPSAYYSFWPPPRSEAHTDEAGDIQVAFWNQIYGSSRRIFIDFEEPGLPVGLSQTVFDQRTDIPHSHRVLPSLVRRIQPNHVVVTDSLVLKGMFDSTVSDPITVHCLEPELVRRLLRKHSKKAEMAKFGFKDEELQVLLEFIQVTGSLDELVGCRLLPLDNGKLAKFTKPLTLCLAKRKYRYLIDKEGFELFRDLGQGMLISPSVLNRDKAGSLQIVPTFSVQHLDGAVIDRFLRVKYQPKDIESFSEDESQWLNKVYKYVTCRNLAVTSYETLPMIPLTTEYTFVSINAWKTLRIMPPVNDAEMKWICGRLPEFYVLPNVLLQNLAAEVKCTPEERFLECVYRLVEGDGPAVEKWFRKNLETHHLKYLKDIYVPFHGSNIRLTAEQTSVLQHMPIWEVTGTNALVTALDALLLPDDDLLPGVHPPGPFILGETEMARDFIIALEGRMLDSKEYLEQHVVPYITAMPDTPARYITLGKLLTFLNLDRNVNLRSLKCIKGPLIPNRNGTFCKATDLYNPQERLFTACFIGDSRFPHPAIDLDSLTKLNFNSFITKSNLAHCFKALDDEYAEGGSVSLYRRAEQVWTIFCDDLEKVKNYEWSRLQLSRLSDYHIIPVRQYNPVAVGYRDITQGRGNVNFTLATLDEITTVNNIPVSWTQRHVASKPPTTWLSNIIDFRPTAEEVVKHLVELTTVVALRCTLDEVNFFTDLKATYEYLSHKDYIDESGTIIHEQYADKAIWLNEDGAIEDIPKGKKHGISLFGGQSRSRIDSLNWKATTSLVHGVTYDTPSCGLYAVKSSILVYQGLLLAAGSKVVTYPMTPQLPPYDENQHKDGLLNSLNEMRASVALCDMIIVVEGKRFLAHRAVLAAVSSFFRSLASSNEWKESITGTLNLDEVTISSETPSYANAECVSSVLDWVYSGVLSLDDTNLVTGEDITTRLDQYLDLLQLTDIWDIPKLKVVIEDRIVQKAYQFIRIENVNDIHDLAKRFNASHVESYCMEFCQMNKHIVEVIETAPVHPVTMPAEEEERDPGCFGNIDLSKILRRSRRQGRRSEREPVL